MSRRNRQLVVWSTAINALGNGAYLPFSLVLLIELTGLPLTRVGLTMTAAALLALALMPLMGNLIDRTGARRALIGAHLLRAAAFAAFPALHTLTAFAAVAALSALTERIARIAQPALIGETVAGAETDRLVALTRSLNNAGMGLGGLAAAMLAGSGASWLYLAASWFNAVTFVGAAAMVAGIRGRQPAVAASARVSRSKEGGYRAVLTDTTFRLLVTSTALGACGYSALTVFLPLYVARLSTPEWASGALFTLNTVMCALAGVPVAAAAASRASRPRVAQLGLGLMAAGFAAIGATAALSTKPILVLLGLVGAMVVYTLGELLHAPMSTALALAGAPAALRGRYMAVNQMAWAVAGALAPALFTALVRWQLQAAPVLLVVLDLLAVVVLGVLQARVRSVTKGSSREVLAAHPAATAALQQHCPEGHPCAR